MSTNNSSSHNKYTPAHIANYFLTMAYGEGREITPLKLMKLVYFSFAWYLYLTDEKLFDEDIQAWKYGPVIPSLYHEFKQYGLHGNITGELATHINLLDEDYEPKRPNINPARLEENETLFDAIQGVWLTYRDNTGKQLVDITHEKQTVWERYYKPGENTSLIDQKEKCDHIKKRAKEAFNNKYRPMFENNS